MKGWVVCVVALLISALLASCSHSSALLAGPLAQQEAASGKSWSTIIAKPGHMVSWGDTDNTNPTDQTMVIESVTYRSTMPGMVQHMVRLWHQEPGVLHRHSPWLPSGRRYQFWIYAVRGARVAPHHDFNVLMALKVPSKHGKLLVGPVYIYYMVGGQHYRIESDHYGGVCVYAPRTEDCPGG